MTEIARRCPEELRLFESHQPSNLFDCLGILDAKGRPLVSLSNEGVLRYHAAWEGGILAGSEPDFFEGIWEDGVLARRVQAICGRLGIPSYKQLPPTTPAVLSYRYLTALLEQAALASRSWECVSGCYATPEAGAGLRSGFGAFPLAVKHLRTAPARILGERAAASGYWFLRVDGKAVLCVCEDGTVWDRDCNAADLVPAYARGHRIWPLVAGTAAAVLP